MNEYVRLGYVIISLGSVGIAVIGALVALAMQAQRRRGAALVAGACGWIAISELAVLAIWEFENQTQFVDYDSVGWYAMSGLTGLLGLSGITLLLASAVAFRPFGAPDE